MLSLLPLLVPLAFASTPASVKPAFQDVVNGSWYYDAVMQLAANGQIDASQKKFRPGDNATRAEFTKLVLVASHKTPSTPPMQPSFDDVSAKAWYFSVIEEAAKQEWIKGDSNCYGSHPCKAHPEQQITRAEAAVLLVRAFGIDRTQKAPRFLDVGDKDWFAYAVQTAADHCILTGDAESIWVRPQDPLNRAEMAQMLLRTQQGGTYGKDCGVGTSMSLKPPSSHSSSISSAVASAMPSSSSAAASSVAASTANGLTVALDPTFPKTEQGMRRGAANVSLLAVTLTASCDSAQTVSKILVRHQGTGSALDITHVYGAADGKIASTSEYDWRNIGWTLTFDPLLSIPACKTVTVSFPADVSDQASPHGDHSLVIGIGDITLTSAAKVRGPLPVKGPAFRVY